MLESKADAHWMRANNSEPAERAMEHIWYGKFSGRSAGQHPSFFVKLDLITGTKMETFETAQKVEGKI